MTASATSSQDPVPSSPTGTVTFKDNGTTICNAVPLTSTGTTTATAPCTVTYATTAGSPHSITASYVNTDGQLHRLQRLGSAPGGHLLDARDFHRPHFLARPFGPGSRGHAHAPRSPSPRVLGPRPARSPSTWAARPAPPSAPGPSTPAAQASATTSSLPAGTDNLYAVYSGDTHFSGSTSPVRVQTVIGLPTKCTGTYPNFFDGNPHFPFILGTNGNDFIYAFGASYFINGFAATTASGPVTGTTGSATATATTCVIAGNGSNTVSVGNGNDTVSRRATAPTASARATAPTR